MQIVVFLTSLSILCYEIILNRIFAITQWQNLSTIIISLALLGFGASGTCIAIFRRDIEKRFESILGCCLLLYPITMCIGFIFYCKIPFNPFEIGIDSFQFFALFIDFMLLSIPLFFGASVIGLILLRFSITKTYFSNLTGSGCGALFIILLSHVFHPYTILLIITGIALISAVLFSFKVRKEIAILTIFFSIIVTTGFTLSIDWLDLRQISPYKSLSKALALPNARILDEKYSPLGLVQIVEADGLRSIAGLSLLSPYKVPVQKGIFFDGDSMSAITPFTGDNNSIGYLNYISSALPYAIMGDGEKNRILIIGTGGGEGVLKALLNKSECITGIEINSDVVTLMKGKYAKFSGNIYNLSNVRIVNQEARSFIRSGKDTYRLIEISMLDTYAAATSGIYALNENYLYTVESFREMIKRLDNNGLLAITRWNMSPPRDILKILSTAVRALEDEGINQPEVHIILIRSVQTSTVVVSKTTLSSEKIERARRFCNSLLFDIIYYPGIKPEETNKYIKTQKPLYYEAAANLLSKNAEEFINEFLFDIRPATDNRPYFYNFFKYRTLNYLFSSYGRAIPFTEWGFLTIVVFLIPALIVSFTFILLPLFLLRKEGSSLKLNTLLFFALTGTGFFFVEMSLIQKFTLFLSHPTYSLTIIISSLLISSGLGSYFSGTIFLRKNRILYSSIIIASIIIISILFLDSLLSKLIQTATYIKAFITMLLIIPAGFFMGIPFPQALSCLKEKNSAHVAWAWGINGFSSVISIMLASLIAIAAGFKIVLLCAALCYLTAGIIWSNRD